MNLQAGNISFIYPHPPLNIRIILVVENAVRKAWEILKIEPPENMDIFDATEKQITLALLDNLQKLKRAKIVDGFNDREFQAVIREGNLINYNGKHLDKESEEYIDGA